MTLPKLRLSLSVAMLSLIVKTWFKANRDLLTCAGERVPAGVAKAGDQGLRYSSAVCPLFSAAS